MKLPLAARLLRSGLILGIVASSLTTLAEDWIVAFLDEKLASVPPDQRVVRLGDMEILVGNLRQWRDQLAGEPTTPSAFDGTAPLWTGGKVHYTFDGSVSPPSNAPFSTVPPSGRCSRTSSSSRGSALVNSGRRIFPLRSARRLWHKRRVTRTGAA